VDDPVLVRGLERLGDLPRYRERLVQRNDARRDSLGECRPLHQLHDERISGIRVLDAVDVRDVGVVQRGEHLRLALEAGESLWIGRDGVGQHLQRDVASQLRIFSAVDLAHSTFAQLGDDLVVAESLPDHDCGLFWATARPR
jgi:hypothetical protein